MQLRPRPDAIDTRIVYKVYSALAWLAGLLLSGWGPMWFGSHLPGQPWGKAALIRVLGAMLIAAGCFAAALAGIDAPAGRRRGLLWLAAGHGAVFVAVVLQRYATWGPGPADWAAQLLFGLVLIFAYLWQTAPGEAAGPGPLLSLFNRPETTDPLRSQYEEQIRQAAGQEERNRLARDLHDSIKQQIFVVQTAAATAQTRYESDPAGARQALEEVRNSAREAMSEMEAMLDQLTAAPLENVGLIEALKKQCEALGFRTGARVEFKPGKLPPSAAFAPGAQQAIFRVAQEALANVGRHARARNVLVTLDSIDRRVVLAIRDDGAGFDPNRVPPGMGIANMVARAGEFGGELELDSRPGGGASVTLSMPFAVQDSALYRRRALGWAVMLVVQILFAIWMRSTGVAFVAVLCAIGVARNAAACLRTREP